MSRLSIRVLFKNNKFHFYLLASLLAQTVKSAGSHGDWGSISGLRRAPGEGNGKPFQYGCLENPMDRAPGGLQSLGSQGARHNFTN